jgi:hypothetical protein
MQGRALTALSQSADCTWATSCHGDDVPAAPMHTAGLGEHLAMCTRHGVPGPLAAMLADAAHRFISARLVTTTALGVGVIGAASWLLWF